MVGCLENLGIDEIRDGGDRGCDGIAEEFECIKRDDCDDNDCCNNSDDCVEDFWL